MKNVFLYSTSIGEIIIADNGAAITDLYFNNRSALQDVKLTETALLKRAAVQLKEYLEGRRRSFDLPLAPRGTAFQLKVWNVLQTIPYGETRKYKVVAEELNQSKASRAVGMANSRNPLLILIPCHRVTGANGKLVGYAGGLDVKEKLLGMEKKYANR